MGEAEDPDHRDSRPVSTIRAQHLIDIREAHRGIQDRVSGCNSAMRLRGNLAYIKHCLRHLQTHEVSFAYVDPTKKIDYVSKIRPTFDMRV